MWMSGNRTARSALAHELLGTLATPLSRMLRVWEPSAPVGDAHIDLPVVLVLGGSRTGSTVLYQTLASSLPFSYLPNLSAMLPDAPILATRISQRLFGRRMGDLVNFYGSVAGLNGPNDGFHVWNRWLGDDRTRIPSSIPDQSREDMRQFFDAWRCAVGTPVLNKNNRNSLCVELLYETLGNVLFVEITRDPVYVVQSLIRSRELIQGSRFIGWGLANRETARMGDAYSYIDDIVAQVCSVRALLQSARRLIPGEDYLSVDYEEFCREPSEVVARVARRVWGDGAEWQPLPCIPPFKSTNQQAVPDEEFRRIVEAVGRYLDDGPKRDVAIADRAPSE
jgi:hypothetical protein